MQDSAETQRLFMLSRRVELLAVATKAGFDEAFVDVHRRGDAHFAEALLVLNPRLCLGAAEAMQLAEVIPVGIGFAPIEGGPIFLGGDGVKADRLVLAVDQLAALNQLCKGID